MQNICNPIGQNSVHISDICNYNSANNNGMLNKRKMKYKKYQKKKFSIWTNLKPYMGKYWLN